MSAPKFEYDRAFQSKMTKTLFQDRDFALTMAGVLDPDLFDSRIHRWTAATILRHAKKYGTGCDKQALKNYLAHAVKIGIFKKQDVANASAYVEGIDKPVRDRDYIKDEIHSFVKNQDTRARILDMVTALEKQDFGEVDRLMSEGQRIQNLGFGSLGHFWSKQATERLHRRRTWKPNGIPTGLPVDGYLKPGGLPPKQLGCIIAPPGRGKTGTMVCIGTHGIILTGVPVLHISLELSEEVMQDRYDAALTKTQLNVLEQPAYRKRVWQKATEVGKKYGECLVIKEFPPQAITVSGIHAYIKQLGSVGFYPGLIMVDYADLIQPTRAYDDSYEEVGLIYQELRGLAVKLNVPIWTASQARRDALDKPVVTMGDFADSFKKAHISDVVLALCQTQQERRQRIARFYIAKNRNGAAEVELPPVRIDWARQLIYVT